MAEYIEREEAIALAKGIVVPTKDGVDYRHRCVDPQDLAELPAANVRPVVRGEWENTEVFTAKGNVDMLQSAFCPVCQK